MCLVIMSPELEVLGEVNLDGTACGRVNLNREGDALLGSHIAEWQTSGLDRNSPCMIKTKDGIGHVVCDQKIKMNSDEFAAAFREWLDDQGFFHLTLPLGAMVAFSEIQKMPIDGQKKYELALMLRDLPVHKLPF